ncbi:glycosyltransferase family 9 protein [Rapidithrix thailandica]|uniref:Glycosyltransferase family 9 protein n=1 Tax=Rapidithrix thailandica TaxID=413964 RepID=A0AAW9S1L6_9BACT
MAKYKNILIIQTAFIGDVILATPIIEKLKTYFPESQIDFLLRKGNESLLKEHPKLRELLIWDKKQGKVKNQLQVIRNIRAKHYDLVINLQRFLSSGLFTTFSKAAFTIGFDKNPLSFTFDKKVPHTFDKHEVERNLSLVHSLTDSQLVKPRLYPSDHDFASIRTYQEAPYICIAPTSVWFTKQYPAEQWIKFIQQIAQDVRIYLLGAPSDKNACEGIANALPEKNILNLAGQLNLLQSAALMQNAVINYVNDSAPMHLASAMNAPVCAVYCSTVPSFGFGPLSDFSRVVEVERELNCRPCGLHGHRSCPKGHFHCAYHIETQQLVNVYQEARELFEIKHKGNRE